MIPIYRFVEVGAYSILNLMPFLLLAIYPFRRHLRFSCSATNGLIIAFMPVQMLLGCLAAFSPVGSEIMSLVSTVIYAGFYFLVIKEQPGKLLFVLLVFSNLGNLVTVCAKYLEGMVFGQLAMEAYRWSLLICMLVMHGAITVPVAFYVRKYFTSNVPIETKSWRYLWIVPATFYVTWYYHLYFSGMDSLLVALDIHHAIFLVIINLGAFVVYHMTILLLFEQQKSTQLTQRNYLLTLNNIQHENLQQRINEARQAKHDVRHHIHLIQEYLHDGKLAELEAYLDQYNASLPSTQSILYCQHYETNSLLGYFVQQAQEQGVAMDVFVQLPEHIALPETTLSVLLGNLLENAIDACKEMPADSGKEKTVTVRGRYDNGFVFFDISNTYSGTLKKTTAGEFLTTKKSGQGLGLGSVSHLVKYHNGVLEVDSTEDTFRVSVMLREQQA